MYGRGEEENMLDTFQNGREFGGEDRERVAKSIRVGSGVYLKGAGYFVVDL